MQLVVNNQTYNVIESPDRLLLWVLRDELGLTGTKFGCGIGVCGSCTVLLDGIATRSCITMLSAVKDKSVYTIEGLAEMTQNDSLSLHPVQQAFLEEQVPQCGWCMPAQMLTAAALLEKSPNPDPEEIRQVMDSVYCRCGAYHRIRKAVERAGEIAVRVGEVRS